MSKEFSLEILTPGRELLRAQVSEIVLPAFDGEVGILADHEDFIGLLGTGPVKIVRGGDDYWFMVSSGVYEVKRGKVTLYAELAETADEVDAQQAAAKVAELEQLFNDPARFDPESYPEQRLAFERNAARVEIHRRTASVH
ncbi:MAG: ATP synthase F1 subunit epsilon [Bdellovibrionales bacterium]|nr:ATP synthase F1 subunit epsilon [Bdellovibrionales bacterium]